MKKARDLADLIKQRTWDKDVVLWTGSERKLIDAIGSVPHQILDLLDLFDENHLPMDDEDTRIVLHKALREKLKSLRANTNRLVLVVRSTGLLARYNVGVRDFYEWFMGDFWMVILALDEIVEPRHWPDEIVCDEDRLIDYFQTVNIVKETYAEGE
jgi:hypothetical protein